MSDLEQAYHDSLRVNLYSETNVLTLWVELAEPSCPSFEGKNHVIKIKVSTVDTLVPTTMKNAAKRDMYCELQNSVNHQNFERSLRPRVIPLVVPH